MTDRMACACGVVPWARLLRPAACLHAWSVHQRAHLHQLAGELFQLPVAQAVGVHCDTSLGASEGHLQSHHTFRLLEQKQWSSGQPRAQPAHPDHGCLPCHEGRQAGHSRSKSAGVLMGEPLLYGTASGSKPTCGLHTCACWVRGHHGKLSTCQLRHLTFVQVHVWGKPEPTLEGAPAVIMLHSASMRTVSGQCDWHRTQMCA